MSESLSPTQVHSHYSSGHLLNKKKKIVHSWVNNVTGWVAEQGWGYFEDTFVPSFGYQAIGTVDCKEPESPAQFQDSFAAEKSKAAVLNLLETTSFGRDQSFHKGSAQTIRKHRCLPPD